MNSFLSFYLFKQSLHEKKIVRSWRDLKKREPFALCGMTRNAGRRVTAHLQLDRATAVVGKTIAWKMVAGKCHFYIHTKRSGHARQRGAAFYASSPFNAPCIRNSYRFRRTNDSRLNNSEIIWRFLSPKLLSKLLIHVYKFRL